MIKIEFKEGKCIKDFHSLDGKVVFEKGETYPFNDFYPVIENKRYSLHWNDSLLEHFKRIRR